MSLLRLEGISKTYRDDPVLDNVTFTLEPRDRVGIIGVNGSGKSTLLRILAGVEAPDRGARHISRDATVGWLRQDPAFEPGQNVRQAVYFFQREALELHEAYARACERMATAESDRLFALCDWDLETRVGIVIGHLGLAGVEEPVERLSGGQLKRVALAQVLVQQPDLLLLDEPTNHLDTAAIEWLEGYLRDYPGALAVVTHDRYFLDAVTNRTVEVSLGALTAYSGNYATYLEKKLAQEELAAASEAKRQNLWRRELEWLRRGPRARATKQKARIERAEELSVSSAVASRSLEIRLGSRRLGKKILELSGVSARGLIRDFSYLMKPGDRLGFVGPNGCGKTTLLDVMAGRLAPSSGTVEMGSTVELGYFSQIPRVLDPSARAVDVVRDVAESIETTDGRVLSAVQLMERFLFGGRLPYTEVGKLSGGERRRLELLCVLMQNPNLLFLDEPTNDLDIPTLERLEEYFDDFPGCLVVVSHDRYFLDRTAETIFAFEGNGKVRQVPGNYSAYLLERPATPSAPVASPRAPTFEVGKRARKITFSEQRELRTLEKTIPLSEARLAELEGLLGGGADAESTLKWYQEQESLKARLERDLERWAELAELEESS